MGSKPTDASNDATGAYALRTFGLTKDFKGFRAVSEINLRVRRGSIHALIGPNGAGKTTVFNLLTKFLAPSAGSIWYGDRDITRHKPADIARMGIVRSFQISAVFPHLSVLDNVRVALQRKLGVSYQFWRSERVLRQTDTRAMDLLDSVGLAEFSSVTTGALAYGRKRALEIATTLALEPSVMLLDEPTAGMAVDDVGRISNLIKQAADGRTVLMVEHNLQVVASLADTITVLNRGEVLAEGDYDDVARDKAVMEAYMGTVGDD